MLKGRVIMDVTNAEQARFAEAAAARDGNARTDQSVYSGRNAGSGDLCRDDPAVRVLAKVNGHIVAAEYKNQFALAFHPEVSGDKRLHEYFLREFFVYK